MENFANDYWDNAPVENRTRNRKRRPPPGNDRWLRMLIAGFGLVLVLVLVAALFWALSSPQFVKTR
jgi:hypothetical protein